MSTKLFVGGLSDDVTEEMLKKKFKDFGKVASVDIHRKKSMTDDMTNVFAFVTINASQQNLNKCIQKLNNCNWNGRNMRLQVARENFLDRLAAERRDTAIVKEWSQNNSTNDEDSINRTSVTISDKTKNTVFKYVTSDDDSDSENEMKINSEDDSSDDDDDIVSSNKKGVRVTETNHKLKKSPARLKVNSSISKKRKARSDDDDDDNNEKSGVNAKKINLKSESATEKPEADNNPKKRKAMSDDDSSDDDDDDDTEATSVNKKQKFESEESMLAEKKRNLEILSSIVGHKSDKKKPPSTFSLQSTAMQRYDPSKPGHEEFEVEAQRESDDNDDDDDDDSEDGLSGSVSKKSEMEFDREESNESSSEEEEEEDEDEKVKDLTDSKQPTTMTSSTSGAQKFAEVSSAVVDAFKRSEAFKLSSLFGNDDDEEEEEEDAEIAAVQPPTKRPKLMTDMLGWDKEESDDDDGDDDGDDDDGNDDDDDYDDDDNDRSDDEGRMDAKEKEGKGKNKKVAARESKFFFEANDPRLKEGNTFCRTDDVEELRKKWEELRPQFVDSYRLRKKRYRMGKPKM